MEGQAMIRVNDLRKSYGRVAAVDGVSFSIVGGDFSGDAISVKSPSIPLFQRGTFNTTTQLVVF
jgi:ABC-type phosphonate transport system ATPase subunit